MQKILGSAQAVSVQKSADSAIRAIEAKKEPPGRVFAMGSLATKSDECAPPDLNWAHERDVLVFWAATGEGPGLVVGPGWWDSGLTVCGCHGSVHVRLLSPWLNPPKLPSR